MTKSQISTSLQEWMNKVVAKEKSKTTYRYIAAVQGKSLQTVKVITFLTLPTVNHSAVSLNNPPLNEPRCPV